MNEQKLTLQRQQYQHALADAVQRIVEALAHRSEVKQAFLFGSYAQGRCDLQTDLDILIVMESPLGFVERTAEMYRYLSSRVDMDLVVYTPEELERQKDWGFVRQALETGKLIYEKQAATDAVELAAQVTGFVTALLTKTDQDNRQSGSDV